MQTLPNISPTAVAGSFEDGGKITCSASPGKAGESFDHLMARTLLPISNEENVGEDFCPTQTKSFKSSGQTSGKDRPKTAGGNPDSGANSSAPLEANVVAVNLENVSIQIVAPVAAVVDEKNELTARAPDANNPGKIPAVVAEGKNVSPTCAKVSSAVVSQNQPGVEAISDAKSDAQGKITAAVNALAGENITSTDSNPSTPSAANPQVPALPEDAIGDLDLTPPIVADKPAAQSPQSGLPASPDLSGKVAPQAGTAMNGTSVAKQEVPMKKTENMNKTDRPAGKILPDASVSVARENNLPPRETVSATVWPRDGQMPATIAANSFPADSTVAQPPADLVAGAASADFRARVLERVQDMVVLHATRLGDSDNVSLQVVIKPGAGTQLSLELRQRGDGVEAQAVLQRGDFAHLNQHWPALQQQLEQRGIRLAPLASDGNFVSGGENNFQPKQNQPAETDSFSAGAFAEVAPSVLTAPNAVGVRTHRGWESWA